MFFTEIDRFQDQGSGFKVQRLQPIDIAHNIDMAAKRRKKHKKNFRSCKFNVLLRTKIEIMTFYESINIDHNPQNPTQPIGSNGFLIMIKTGSL